MAAGAAVFSITKVAASRQARVERRTLDIVVWIGIDAISGFARRIDLKRPWTPVPYLMRRHGLIERQRICRIGTKFLVGICALGCQITG